VYIDAVEDSQVLQVSSSVISLLMHDNIYVEAFANRAAAERFSDVMWAMQQILFMSFDRRLAIFLLDESASLGTDRLTLTHEQIAKLMGSAREVVTRMLKYFSQEGYVALSRGSVTLLDKKALRKLADTQP
jgi:CRP/FNR family transcriptional regulator